MNGANVLIECGRNQLPDEREDSVFVPPVWTFEMFDFSVAKHRFLCLNRLKGCEMSAALQQTGSV